MEDYDPFQIPQQKIHFFKKFRLDDYPFRSLFGFSGDVFMAIFQDGTIKEVVRWPVDLNFIPINYSPSAYVLLYYFDADKPPDLYTLDRDIPFPQPPSLFDDYLPLTSTSRSYAFTNQITLTLPKMTVRSGPQSP
jgi:hypothetical protein